MYLVLFLTCLALANIECQLIVPTIIGGKPVEITSVPFQLSLHYKGQFLCGATLITPGIALTAAHCVWEPYNDVTVHAGSDNKKLGIEQKVSSIKVHPDYNGMTLINDIAILWLKENFAITDKINIAKLPEANFELPVESKVSAYGWGLTNESADAGPDVLLGVDVFIVDREYCKEIYNKEKKLVNVTESMLCAGVNEGGKDACYGDSGGPLIFNGVLIGIVSWGYHCALPGYPGVYTQVSSYISFINDSIAKQLALH